MPGTGTKAWTHAVSPAISMSTPVMPAAEATSGRRSGPASFASNGSPTTLLLTERSHGAPNRSGVSSRSVRLAVRPTAATATTTAAPKLARAVPTSTGAPVRRRASCRPAVSTGGSAGVQVARVPSTTGAGGRSARRRASGTHAAVAVTPNTARPPRISTVASTATPRSTSASRPTPIGPRGDSATAVIAAAAAAGSPMAAPRRAAAVPASRPVIPMARRMGPSLHSRRLCRTTAWPMKIATTTAMMRPRAITACAS